MASQRALLRLAARDVRRAPRRSLIVVLMIALPVMAAVAIAVIAQTSRVPTSDKVNRILGRADASITWQPTAVAQAPDPSTNIALLERHPTRPQTAATIRQILGPVTLQTSQETGFLVRSSAGSINVTLEETDLRSGIADGRWNLITGRFPRAQREAVISGDLADKGLRLGSTLQINGRALVVTGVIRSGNTREPSAAVSLPGSVPMPPDAGTPTYYVSGHPVTWAQVRALNAVGGVVTSREVLLDPPSKDQIPTEALVSTTPFFTRTTVVAAALVVTMALLEVILLAGPAFAVTARRQSRVLAMLSAAGATRRQRRGVVLSTGLVLGAASAGVGLVGGIVLARAILPAVEPMTSSWFGPFQVPITVVLAIAACGLASALMAAFVPAWLAGREDVVLVLAGRRAEQTPRARTPIIGLALMGLGVASALAATTSTRLDAAGYTTVLLPLAALLTVVGAIFVTPLALSIVARLATRLPLALRYAARDSVRHGLRTVPAVAAVTATAAGAIAAGMAIASQDAFTRAGYIPTLPIGSAAVTLADPASARVVERTITKDLPRATVVPLRGISAAPTTTQTNVSMSYGPGVPAAIAYNTTLGAKVLVADQIPDAVPTFSATERSRGEQVLASGGVVVFGPPDRHPTVTVAVTTVARGRTLTSAKATFATAAITSNGGAVAAVLSPAAAQRLGIQPVVTAIAISGASWGSGRTQTVNADLAKIKASTILYVEPGPSDDSRGRAIGWVILVLASLVAIVGTVTATSLSLSDARPDLATMSAVGASRLTRRAVAGSFALLIGGVGAILGVVVGLVPGIALAYRLTRSSGQTLADGSLMPSHYVVMPWTMVGAILLLPLFVGLIVSAATRARLPIRARLD
jgi:putative ABC transport system permease protein